MRFLPKTTCEKLVKMGCKSESRLYFGRLKDEADHGLASLTLEEIKEIDCLWFDVGYYGGLIVKRIGPYLLSDGMNIFNQERDMIFCTPAFTLEDFVSTDEYAKENCRKLFGEREYYPHKLEIPAFGVLKNEGWEQSRHQLIGSKDWVEFISEAVEEYEEEK